jgi:hypothetical protein
MRTLAPLFGVLMLIALIIKLIWCILGAVALYVLFRVARWQLRLARFRREAEAWRGAQVAAPAEQQHRGSFKVTTAESTVSIRWPTSSVSGVDHYRLDAGR